VFYRAWDQISRDRDCFNAWIKANILETGDFAEYLQAVSQ